MLMAQLAMQEKQGDVFFPFVRGPQPPDEMIRLPRKALTRKPHGRERETARRRRQRESGTRIAVKCLSRKHASASPLVA